ncbi:MAG: glycosyl hydrolase, partial [Flavobacteriales bacterium]|nr:glycosyl hydrolase [Flavobacteriales bacterium]
MLLSASSTFSQEWIRSAQEGDNMYDVAAEFNQFWEGKTPGKGQGFKQFARWKNFWEPRLYPSGDWSSIDQQAFMEAIRNSDEAQRDGGNWSELGLDEWQSSSYAPGNGRVNCVAIDPNNPNLYYVGTPAGGIWKGTGNGDWTPISEQLPTMGVSGIVVTDAEPSTIYIGTGDSDGFDTYSVGVLKSTNEGQSWETTGLTFTLSQSVRTNRLMAKPGDFETLFCATSSGLYKTTDGGLVWESVLNGNIRDLEFKPGNPEVMYASSNRLYISTDGGENWDSVSDIMPSPAVTERVAIAVTEAEPDYIYLLYADNSFNAFEGLYRSTDGGDSWVLRSDSPNILSSDEDGNSSSGQAWYDMEVAVSPTNAQRVLVGGVNVWESNNGGSSWNLNADWTWPNGGGIGYVHADLHHIEFMNGMLVIGSDGGLFVSTNEGDTYSDLSEGLGISQFYRISVYDGDSDLLMAGAQDNGTNRLNNGTWTHVLGGDGMQTLIHPTDPDIMFASFQYGGINKSTNGGEDWDWSASGINEDGAWTTPYMFSPANPDV